MSSPYDLIVNCDNGERGSVQVLSHHTIADVREMVVDEFDDDMLPESGTVEFFFKVGDIRVAFRQEEKRSAWDIFHPGGKMKHIFSLHPKPPENGKRKRSISGEGEYADLKPVERASEEKIREISAAVVNDRVRKTESLCKIENIPPGSIDILTGIPRVTIRNRGVKTETNVTVSEEENFEKRIDSLFTSSNKSKGRRKAKEHTEEPKPFHIMNKMEVAEFFADSDLEENFLKKLLLRLEGAWCEVCYVRDDNPMNPDQEETIEQSLTNESDKSVTISTRHQPSNALSRCIGCGIVYHKDCYFGHNITSTDKDDKLGKKKCSPHTSICDACRYIRDRMREMSPENTSNSNNILPESSYENPKCHMCNQESGALKKAFATPTSMRAWKKKMPLFRKSLFGKKIWCHVVCGMWHPHCQYQNEKDAKPDHFDCAGVIIANGIGHTNENHVCALCCRHDKVKLGCGQKGCQAVGCLKKAPFRFHLSCARQAGLEVVDTNNISGKIDFRVLCFEHMNSQYALRASLEDFIDLERGRIGLESFDKVDLPMSIPHVAKLLHWGVDILKTLGWAWKWAEWWVEKSDRWQPLLEEGQKVEDISKEQLGIVDSTKESRCDDARKCRLSAFGAALRNRNYDDNESDDQVALDRALRAILSVPSLVGPWEPYEIDFFAEWLARAYRSRSPLLGFGHDKIPVANHGRCVHMMDGTPKYELGNRTLPGKADLPKGIIFENVEEVDDFLQAEVIDEFHPYSSKKIANTNGGKRRKKRLTVGSTFCQPSLSETEYEYTLMPKSSALPKPVIKSFPQPKYVACEAVEYVKESKEVVDDDNSHTASLLNSPSILKRGRGRPPKNT